jgi:type I site-specific restriction endonuclease
MNEADTCRRLVVPRLQAAGWDTEPHSIAEQRTITDGRIVPVGQGFIQGALDAEYVRRRELGALRPQDLARR